MRRPSFISQYLQDLIPVAFELETAQEFQIMGRGPAQFKVKLNREIPKKELLESTSLALGEAYIRGDLELDRDLYEVLDMFLGQMDHFRLNQTALHGLLHTSLGVKNQQQEISFHYDLGNDFYRLWLDETMSYSCGYFKNPGDTLFEAQVAKADHILKKLHLEMGMTLLDIGCGWGFLLMRAVRRYGVKGVGITLSQEQYELFLKNASQVLKPSGLFLLHFISAQEEHAGDPFIRKYIFPGGVIPSLREIINLLPEYRLRTLDVESLRRHYTKTLLCWRENFKKHKDTIEAERGEDFVRMWELYLASCAAAFHQGVVDLHQILMSKGVNNELPMVRSGG